MKVLELILQVDQCSRRESFQMLKHGKIVTYHGDTCVFSLTFAILCDKARSDHLYHVYKYIATQCSYHIDTSTISMR